MPDTKITIQGMSCGHCVVAVRDALARLEIGSVSLAYHAAEVTMEQIAGAVEAAGYASSAGASA